MSEKNERTRVDEAGDKRIEVCQMPIRSLKNGFGNPRRITPKKRAELEDSIEQFGDFGIFLIDEQDNVIAGNQRQKVILAKYPDAVVTCKRLIGYTEAELRAINITDNTHAGDWDLDVLAEWTADLNTNFGIETTIEDPKDREIPEMELIHYERYNYVMIVCKNEIDYNDLVRKLGIEGKKVAMGSSKKARRIAARAVWYDDMKAQIVEKQEDE